MMSNREFNNDDELLGAWIDGELPRTEADALSERLAREPQLVQRLEAMRMADDAVRQAYAQVDSLPLPDAVLSQFDAPGAKSSGDNVVAFPARGVRRFFDMPVAIAASVALVAGFLGATMLRNDVAPTIDNSALLAGVVEHGTPLEQLLESMPSGEARDLAGSRAQVLLTFEDVSGDWCRHLRVDEPDRAVHALACRRDGGWQLETIALGAGGVAAGQFGTASGAVPGAIDGAVDALIGAGVPLETQEESLVISNSWEKPGE